MSQNALRRSVRVAQDFGCGNAKRVGAQTQKMCVALGILIRSGLVLEAVDLDGAAGAGAEEIENEGTDRVLATKAASP